jgi:glycosyltransferase involved in cell wall biosynthesis
MNITHVITTIERGGAENQLLILTKMQVQHGHSVSVVFIKGKPELEEAFILNGVTVISSLANIGFLKQVFLLRKISYRSNNVYHAHLPRAELLLRLSLYKRKFFISRHNCEPFFPKAPKVISSFLSRFVARKANAFIAISNSVKEYITMNNEIRSDSICKTIYYGFEEVSPKIDSTTIKKNHGSFTIGTIGRLVPQKNYPLLLEAFYQVKQQIPTANFIIVGDGFLKEDLQKLAIRLAINSSINWVGRTDNVFEYLSAMDCFVLASHYEGFGLVFLEAMSQAIPIVAMVNPTALEILGNDYPSISAEMDASDFADKVIALQDSNWNQSVSQICVDRLRKFDVQFQYSETIALYSSFAT